MVQFILKLLFKQISCCTSRFPLILTSKFHSLHAEESESEILESRSRIFYLRPCNPARVYAVSGNFYSCFDTSIRNSYLFANSLIVGTTARWHASRLSVLVSGHLVWTFNPVVRHCFHWTVLCHVVLTLRSCVLNNLLHIWLQASEAIKLRVLLENCLRTKWW